jgi:transcriptional regulator with XRE-family HTH domain
LTNRQLGTHPSLIKRNSRDPDLPSINALRRIAKALGVPVTELLE